MSLPGNREWPASIEWMAQLGLKEGEWFHASKPALKGGMRPTFELKARVWCCGRLHAESYQGELALGMFRGKKIPLSPAGIAKELHDEALAFYAEAGKNLRDEEKKTLKVSRQNVRRALAELEEEGVAERRTVEGLLLRDLSHEQLRRLPIGRIRLYFFVRPRPAKRVPDVIKYDYVSFPFLSPSEGRLFSKILRRFELDPVPYVAGDAYVQETAKRALAEYQQVESVARTDYEKTENVAAETLKKSLDVAAATERIVSNPVSNSVRNGDSGAAPASSVLRAIDNNPSSSSAFPLVSGPAPPLRGRKAEEEDSPSLYQTFKYEYPAGRFDEPKSKPAFEKKTKAQQREVIERLRVYLASPRWKSDGGCWVPFASTWLKDDYLSQPPPVLEKRARNSSGGETFDKAFGAAED